MGMFGFICRELTLNSSPVERGSLKRILDESIWECELELNSWKMHLNSNMNLNLHPIPIPIPLSGEFEFVCVEIDHPNARIFAFKNGFTINDMNFVHFRGDLFIRGGARARGQTHLKINLKYIDVDRFYLHGWKNQFVKRWKENEDEDSSDFEVDSSDLQFVHFNLKIQ